MLRTIFNSMNGKIPKDWVKWLSLVEWWYKAIFHSTIKASPYKARDHLCTSPTKFEAQSLIFWIKVMKSLKENLSRAINIMKHMADKGIMHKEF